MPRGRAIKPHRKALILLDLARGLSNEAILDRYKIAGATLERIRAEPNFREASDRARWQILEHAHMDFLEGTKYSTEKVRELLDHEDPEVRLKAASLMISSFCKFTQQSLTLEAFTKLRQADQIEQNNVLGALTADQVKSLVQQGAILKSLDLSKVPTDFVKVCMREISVEKVAGNGEGNGVEGAKQKFSMLNSEQK